MRREVLEKDELALLRLTAVIDVDHLKLLRLLLLELRSHLHTLELLLSATLHLVAVNLQLGRVGDIESLVHFLLEELILWTEQALRQLRFSEVWEAQLAFGLRGRGRLIFLRTSVLSNGGGVRVYLAVFGPVQPAALARALAQTFLLEVFVLARIVLDLLGGAIF